MDVSIELDHTNVTFTAGEIVHGKVIIYCPRTTTLSKISVRLIGETISNLSGSSSLLMCRKNEETHRVSNKLEIQIYLVLKDVFLIYIQVAHDSRDIIPYFHTSKDTKKESVRLRFGYHSFSFSLQVK